MAKQGAKKMKDENKKHMGFLLRLILASNVSSFHLQIPVFAGYKIFGLLRGTLLSRGSEGEVEDEKTRKKREKMEKKAPRGKIIKTRTR
ncbi:hypothetical protein PR202_gb22534 [Eleusine coracana subsp. coracana]|uniref:Uncharacterized protein n=1 Tax=Eleusine coracana subsp. coracana TaxID=191504 RepID=A0AAV5FGJ3_ELECO|nr:hypothetical protein PR202_gb22534 [Eleusine coracana subsp. coracana]